MRTATLVALKAFDQLWRLREREMRMMNLPKGQEVKLQYTFPCLVTYPGAYDESKKIATYNGKDVKVKFTTSEGVELELPFESINYTENRP